MIQFFRKIRQQLLTENKFSKYLFYALGEIVLVVIGILIALQINNWNQNRIKNQEEIKIYQNIKRQIVDDLGEINRVIGFNNYFIGQFESASRIISSNDESKVDTLAMISMTLSQYSDFNGSGNIYETLINSGDLKLIRHAEIPSRLQTLEMTYTYLNKLEDIHWDIIMNELSPEMKGVINYANMQIVKPEKLYSVELQNIIIELIYLSKGKDAIYKQAFTEINDMIALIDEELN